MAEMIVLAAFAASLFICIGLNISVLAALVFGFCLFFFYGLHQKHTASEMFSMAFSGIQTVKNILITFVLIGILTAVWRAGGTIAYIVYFATRFCHPRAMVLITFLLCCLISFLTGTAFGTAATMGVICVTMANSMGIPILYTGGAVLAGSYFGDRCSPMSTSALLISTLTNTSLFRNLGNMMKTSLVPFVLTCILYTLIGRSLEVHPDTSGIEKLFEEYFVLHPAVLIPAAVILLFSLLRINVKITMSISALCGLIVSVLVQSIAPSELLHIALFGYHPANPEVASVLTGGGIFSMTKVFCIVCLSSCYSGMFNGTGLLEGIRKSLLKISQRLTAFGSILVTSLLTSMISCNQTLTIMLTYQLCGDLEDNPEEAAVHLENTAVVIAPLIPWSIAGAVPLASAGAPGTCILTACYLFLLPVWNFILELRKHRAGASGK